VSSRFIARVITISGWLNTQAKTGGLPFLPISFCRTLKLLKQFPEFVYSMESTTYLMEFLERHPELAR